MNPQPDIRQALADLEARFGDRLVQIPARREQFAGGQDSRGDRIPDAVFAPKTTEEVSEALLICGHHGLPVVPSGARTSLEGQLDIVCGALSLDLTPLDQILQVNSADLDVHVQAGVTREALNAHLRDQGLFFPLDPGANATLGGMASTRASGTNAVRYGTMREVTLGLTVVTASGEIVRTGGRARKSSTGYDLTHLFVGSEGTLGVITELRLKLFGIPETIAAGIFQFENDEAAIEAVTSLLQIGIPVARIEYMDPLQVQASIAYSRIEDLEIKPTLFVELHGSPASVALDREQVEALFTNFGAAPPKWAERPEDRTKIWKARHDAYWAARALKPGHETIATDACVPISELPTAINKAQALAAASNLLCPIVGHVGDGNFHMLILHAPEERGSAEALAEGVSQLALSLGGTVSGEHGIGLYRKKLMREEHGKAVNLMQSIKAALDPLGIMNPGKIVD